MGDDPFNPTGDAPSFGGASDSFAPPQLAPPAPDPFSSAGLFSEDINGSSFAAAPDFNADAPPPPVAAPADLFGATPDGDDPFGFDAPVAPNASVTGATASAEPSADVNSLLAPPKGEWFCPTALQRRETRLPLFVITYPL